MMRRGDAVAALCIVYPRRRDALTDSPLKRSVGRCNADTHYSLVVEIEAAAAAAACRKSTNRTRTAEN